MILSTGLTATRSILAVLGIMWLMGWIDNFILKSIGFFHKIRYTFIVKGEG